MRREWIGEIGRWVEGDYWHLNRVFDGVSLFFGSGIHAFIDPQERFLILRDSGVILLFDYRDGNAWHARARWLEKDATLEVWFPKVVFEENGVKFHWPELERTCGHEGIFVPEDRLDAFLVKGLGESRDGFLANWRPEPGKENLYSPRLKTGSSILDGS